MKSWIKILALTLTLVLVASAIGAAVVMAADGKINGPAVGTTQSPTNAYDQLLLTKLVTKLGVTLDNLKATYKTARLEVLAQEVTDSRLTQAQADQIKTQWDKETDVRISFTMGMIGFGRGPMGEGPRSNAAPPATPTAPPANTYDTLLLNKIVTKLGVTLDNFKAAYKAARLEVLAQQVTDGKLTQKQADDIKAMWEKMGDNGLFAPVRMPFLAGNFDPAAGEKQFLEKLSANLGTTVDKFTAAYKATRLDILAQQVKDGRLTQAQADQIKAQWDKETNVHTGLGFGIGPMPGGPGGPGGHGGPGRGTPPATTTTK